MPTTRRKKSEKMVIEQYDGLNNTPALPLALEGWHSLVQRGLTDNTIVIGWDDKALVYRKGGVAMGVLTFDLTEWRKEIYVKIGFVLPQYRRKGVYTALFDCLTEYARRKGIKFIVGATLTANAEMRATYKKQGRAEFAIISKFEVK